jgi:transposase
VRAWTAVDAIVCVRHGRYRRTVRDYERLPASHEAMMFWAMIALMTRRLAQPAQ